MRVPCARAMAIIASSVAPAASVLRDHATKASYKPWMQPRAIHYVSAVLVGLGIGVIAYRFAVLGFFWNGSPSFLFPALGSGLVAVGFAIQAKDTQGERPRVATRIALAIVGIAAAMGVLYVVVPPLSRIVLARTQLPGFSFELPTAKPSVDNRDYNTGTITWKELGGANAVLTVSWQTGGATTQDLEIGMKAVADKIGTGSAVHTTMSGPGGKSADTMIVDTDKGVPLRMTMLPCGNRGVLVMSIGAAGIEEVHERILPTFVCTPDAAKEQTAAGEIRVALSLPGWSISEKEVGQVTLMDPEEKAILILREISASDTKLEDAIVPLFNAFGGQVTEKPRVGDRVPFVGTIDGSQVEGWARRVECKTHHVLLIAMASTAADAEAAYVASSNAGCLRDGEKPPVWPEAPAAPADDAPAATE